MSTIRVTNLQNASAASPAIVLDANSRATLNGLSYPTEGSLSGRNRIINGDMRIDQRNAGASVNPATGSYTLDRWFGGGVHDGTLAFQRVSDGPTGFTNSLKVTVSTADSSLSATQYARVLQVIEGYNVADFAGGTASPATATFSFWIKSSVTGTYGGHIASGDESRLYVFQYTVNAANTWEYKSVTVTLPTSGTWATDNTAGMRVTFSLGAGSSYVNTANTWLTSYAQQASGNVNLINTLNATWQITGVQLEAGSVATPFERRSYGQELLLCERYFETNYPAGFAVGSNSGTDGCWVSVSLNTFDFYDFGRLTFRTPKRANATLQLYNPVSGGGSYYDYNIAAANGNVASRLIGQHGAQLYASTPYTANHAYLVRYAASAEL